MRKGSKILAEMRLRAVFAISFHSVKVFYQFFKNTVETHCGFGTVLG